MRMVETPPGSADEFEVILDDDERLVVRRHSRWVQRLAFPVFILFTMQISVGCQKCFLRLPVGIPFILFLK